MNPIIKYKNKDNTEILEIFQDEIPSSPREDDNMGIMLCCHRRYTLGDKQFNDVDSLDEYVKELKPLIKLPLFLLDHSGLRISTSDFNDKWDSGEIGYIVATKESIENMMGKDTKHSRDDLVKYLNSEVDIYNDYLSGSVYGYVVSKLETCSLNEIHKTEIDSCWGIYDDPEKIASSVDCDKWERIE